MIEKLFKVRNDKFTKFQFTSNLYIKRAWDGEDRD